MKYMYQQNQTKFQPQVKTLNFWQCLIEIFLRVKLTISEHWLRKYRGAIRAKIRHDIWCRKAKIR